MDNHSRKVIEAEILIVELESKISLTSKSISSLDLEKRRKGFQIIQMKKQSSEIQDFAKNVSSLKKQKLAKVVALKGKGGEEEEQARIDYINVINREAELEDKCGGSLLSVNKLQSQINELRAKICVVEAKKKMQMNELMDAKARSCRLKKALALKRKFSAQMERKLKCEDDNVWMDGCSDIELSMCLDSTEELAKKMKMDDSKEDDVVLEGAVGNVKEVELDCSLKDVDMACASLDQHGDEFMKRVTDCEADKDVDGANIGSFNDEIVKDPIVDLKEDGDDFMKSVTDCETIKNVDGANDGSVNDEIVKDPIVDLKEDGDVAKLDGRLDVSCAENVNENVNVSALGGNHLIVDQKCSEVTDAVMVDDDDQVGLDQLLEVV